MKTVISSGHGKYIRGAEGPSPWGLDEVDEARKVVETVADALRELGVEVTTYHDDVSTTQSENLTRICDFHNSRTRDLDVSVHFNAYTVTSKPMGTEVLYVTQEALAQTVCDAICNAAGFLNRGPKYRSDLKFLNATEEPSILIETCFVDSSDDVEVYHENYDVICNAIAEAIADKKLDAQPPEPWEPPLEPGRPPVPPAPERRRTIGNGDEGPDVFMLQQSLGLPPDGMFGSITQTWVKAFQAACGLSPVDGIVGDDTWAEIDDLNRRMLLAVPELSDTQISAITAIARSSPLMNFYWPGRGVAPAGYIPGMALAFAVALLDLDLGMPAADVMAEADTNDPDDDALSWYRTELLEQGLRIDETGPDTVRALFVLMMGLGMRESSGRCWEGRDLSADNVEAETAEAGMLQTSWNIATADDSLPPMLDEYWDDPTGFLHVFDEGIAPTKSNLDCYGSGDGARYQFLARFAPLFACMTTAVGLRTRRQHWGPVNRREVSIQADAAELLQEIQTLVESIA